MSAILTPCAARLASARAAATRINASQRRLVRIVGDDSGVYTIAEIMARLGADAATASRLIARQRKRGHVTWAALRGLAQAVPR